MAWPKFSVFRKPAETNGWLPWWYVTLKNECDDRYYNRNFRIPRQPRYHYEIRRKPFNKQPGVQALSNVRNPQFPFVDETARPPKAPRPIHSKLAPIELFRNNLPKSKADADLVDVDTKTSRSGTQSFYPYEPRQCHVDQYDHRCNDKDKASGYDNTLFRSTLSDSPHSTSQSPRHSPCHCSGDRAQVPIIPHNQHKTFYPKQLYDHQHLYPHGPGAYGHPMAREQHQVPDKVWASQQPSWKCNTGHHAHMYRQRHLHGGHPKQVGTHHRQASDVIRDTPRPQANKCRSRRRESFHRERRHSVPTAFNYIDPHHDLRARPWKT